MEHPCFGAEAPTTQREEVCGLKLHSQAKAEVEADKAPHAVPASLVG